MFKQLIIISLFLSTLSAIEITQKPITFTPHRETLTLEYIKTHYGLHPSDIKITPRVIVVHYTAIDTLEGSFNAFDAETLPSSRSDIGSTQESANVSVAYLIDKDGTIYQLMPENQMGRHVIGLNYRSIGIENVGHLNTLTPQQLQANIELIHYLKTNNPSIDYLIAHSDYTCMESTPLWLEKDKGYRTHKEDPGEAFMQKIYKVLPNFKRAPCP